MPEHENLFNHKHYFYNWEFLEISLGKKSIDKELQNAIQTEEIH